MAAVKLLRAAPRAIWPILAVLAVISLGMDLVARQMGVPLDGPQYAASTWGYLAVLSLMTSSVVGVVLHILLTGRGPIGLSAGFVGFVARPQQRQPSCCPGSRWSRSVAWAGPSF